MFNSIINVCVNLKYMLRYRNNCKLIEFPQLINFPQHAFHEKRSGNETVQRWQWDGITFAARTKIICINKKIYNIIEQLSDGGHLNEQWPLRQFACLVPQHFTQHHKSPVVIRIVDRLLIFGYWRIVLCESTLHIFGARNTGELGIKSYNCYCYCYCCYLCCRCCFCCWWGYWCCMKCATRLYCQ